jgi:hypothetical protein
MAPLDRSGGGGGFQQKHRSNGTKQRQALSSSSLSTHSSTSSCYARQCRRRRLDLMACYFLGLYGCSTILYMIYSQSFMAEDEGRQHQYHGEVHHQEQERMIGLGKGRKPSSMFEFALSKFAQGTTSTGSGITQTESLSGTMATASLYPVLTAYMEAPVAKEQWDAIPLPRRNTTANKLKAMSYPLVNSCLNLPSLWPVNPQERNVTSTSRMASNPVDVDPFLPWIHDVFPSSDGSSLIVVAQNKRRCHTGKNNEDLMSFMEPQVSLMQPLAVKRMNADESSKDGETLFRLSKHEEADADGIETRFLCQFHSSTQEVDKKTQTIKLNKNITTLSKHELNYEYIQFHKMGGNKPAKYKMFDKTGKNNAALWDSQYVFECPIPDVLQESVRLGYHLMDVNRYSDSTAGTERSSDIYTSLFVDIVPIRTPARLGQVFLPPHRRGTDYIPPDKQFNAEQQFGSNHVLPSIQSSGRWANIPVCQPSYDTYHGRKGQRQGRDNTNGDLSKNSDEKSSPNAVPSEKYVDSGLATTTDLDLTNTISPPTTPIKPHTLVACTWASASFETRGKSSVVNDGHDRLKEWIAFHLMVGFDHVYVYDNTHAFFPNATPVNTLQHITDLFPDDKVTHIHWPSQVCNNNWPGNPDPGERSSQYAAETSCRLRFGPYTDWMASFDMDEYFVPMGKDMTSLKQLTQQADDRGDKIIGFRIVRGKLRRDRTE